MQKAKKIELYLKKNPHATPRDIERKFRLSRIEARTIVYGDSAVSSDVNQSGDFFAAWYKSERTVMATIFFLALAVRALYAFLILRHPNLMVPLHDAKYYLSWAQDILENGWLGQRVFFTEPFYAYFLALILKISGSSVVILCLQWLFGSVAVIGLYLLARQLFGRRAALVTGILSALYGPFLFYEGLLLKTSLEVALLPWFLLLVLFAFERKRIGLFLASGLVLGVLSLIKGNNLIFTLVVVGGVLWFERGVMLAKRLVWVGGFLLGLSIIIAPVTVRNITIGHDRVLTNYSFGLAFYQGSWWGGDGSTALVPPFLRPDPRYEEEDATGMAEAYAGRSLQPSAVSSFWVSKAWEEIADAPLHFLDTLWHKLLILFHHSEFSDNYQFIYYRHVLPLLWVLPNFFLVSLFGVMGLMVSRTRHFREAFPDDGGFAKRIALFSLFFLASVSVLFLATVNARYRVPLVPFLVVLGSGAIVYICHCLREEYYGKLLPLVVIAIMMLLIGFYPLALTRFDTVAQSYHALGYEALLNGRYGEAREWFQKTILTDPQYAWAYGNKALSELAQNHEVEAEAALKKLIVLRGDDISNYRLLKFVRELKGQSEMKKRVAVAEYVTHEDRPTYDADYNEANRFLAAGNEVQAEFFFRRSLERHPEAVATKIALAALVKKQNHLEEARKLLQEVVDQSPEIFSARYNLANVYIAENNFAPAADLLKDIYDFTPELGETWYNYAVALIKLGRNSEAIPVMQAYIDRYQDDEGHRTVVEKFRTALKPATNNIDALLKGKQGQ